MTGYVATIGMFDGVHRGHQFVLSQVVNYAREKGLQSMAITLDGGPRSKEQGARGESTMLTSKDAKLVLLSKTGIDRVEVLPFTDELRQMTAREFMQRVLKEQLNVKVLMTGYDNRFGHNREEGFNDYVRYGCELGIEVLQLPVGPQNVSSSLIRKQVAEGRVAEANGNLGYPYTIFGHVVHGEHIGSQLGFPTANLELEDDRQLIPATGVYAVKVRMENSLEWKHGMMNIGTRPTFSGHQTTLEVNVFRLRENLYGQRLLVAFIDRLRSEQQFDDIEALKQQLQKDAEAAEERMKE